ncbi:MAG TPA: malto-oligosyltrehalose trehalohydrolase [Candidatus Binataceae bacterium]|nr:malto-oligosyltrehalose trehalohydrolase [Candidatus Binataceae bacterium]
MRSSQNPEKTWRLEFGARPTNEGVSFRVWAPLAKSVAVQTVDSRGTTTTAIPMERNADGTFTAFVEKMSPGADYYYELDHERRRPDPVSRFQPHGVHGASRVIHPNSFPWTDSDWKGLQLEDAIFYELHTGTFTAEGGFTSIIERLPYLRDLGITAVELMPVAAFPGSRNWGYDGVCLYAPHVAYGGPDGLKQLVDACHRTGLAVVLDVVYNHLGPEGNYLSEFASFFTDRYRSPWGQALNFDDANSDGVRRFFIENALYWLTEYHIDGLRLDAIHGIFDFSAHHLLREMADDFHAQARALGRHAWLIAESDLDDTRIINPASIGGYGLDAQWSDDFHHALHTLLTGKRHGYLADFGRVEDLRDALTNGFVYDGRYSEYRKRRHGTSSAANPGQQFVVFNQNHDQVANAEAGTRLSGLVTLEQQKIASMILMCTPNLPLLFMGEEFGASSPFDYFTSFDDPALAQAVSEGRKREYEPFFKDRPFADPQAPETFARSRLNWDEIEESPHRELLEFHRALISLRTRRDCLSNCRKDLTRVDFDERARCIVVERAEPSGDSAFLFCNLSDQPCDLRVPYAASASRLELFSGERRFGGAPTTDAPPSTLDSSCVTIRLAPCTAALYFKDAAVRATR